MKTEEDISKLILAAKRVVQMAKLEKQLCDCTPCPCVMSSYNDCRYNWSMSKTINELKDTLKLFEEKK